MELRHFQDRLNKKGVDVYQRRLQQMQGKHRDFGVLAIRPGQVAVLAIEDDGVAGVPVLHHL
jgi:hypothetical protein